MSASESTSPAQAAPEAVAELINSLGSGPGSDLGWTQEFYEWMHAHPELSLQEEHTAHAIAEKLAHFDCEVTTGIGGHGIVAIFRNGEGPTALMRADFDALPVRETTGLPYASTVDGVMHACGHDVHTSSLLGLCAVMDAHREAWSGTFIALFQPAEEVTQGANNMIKDGLAEVIPRPDVCFGQHVVAGPQGTVYTAAGPVLAACDTITVTIPGLSAHASSPHLGLDPSYVAAMIVVRLQGIVGREVDPNDFAVISVGSLIAGHTNNTIPSEAKLVLNCRFYNTEVRDRTYEAIERVIRGECLASGVTGEPTIEYSARGELTDNDAELFRTVRPYFDAVFGGQSQDSERWTASEDFSEIPRHFGCPYLFWTVGVTPTAQWDAATPAPGNHASDFAPAKGSVHTGIKAAAAAVLGYLGV
ncbi:amidohydrolase [Corynebacterium sp. UMB9976]|uniref:amidohydrolase n=1 Tax=Corynebacterium sp. UMB9976 TaxID=3046354 RepID=UPI00254AB8DC|nr:amidohydrolase [Corynebacterium sp. UMB9976]MDK6302724.1 amidohydrolase [Corynebacterium sp. UMB9976]